MTTVRTIILAILLLVVGSPLTSAQTTLPATTQSAATRAVGLSDEQLLGLFRQELGKQFDPAASQIYLQAHNLIEDYFAATAQKDRGAIVKQLEGTGLDANLLGRLTRIRRPWQPLAGGVYFVNDTFGSVDVKYFLGIPRSYSPLTSSPLVIVLPTADAFLANPPPDNLGVTKIYREWMTDELARQRDAVVLMPLLNLDELYGPGRIGMNSVMQCIRHVPELANIDPQRVDLMGHSMGGHATWNLALHYPTYFAAIAPLAAAADADWQRLRLMNLRNVLPVIWNDADDQINPVKESRSIVSSLRIMKIDLQYVETKGIGHVPPPQVIAQVCEAMRARVRELYPKEVLLQSNKPETVFNRADWLQVYQTLKPGPEQRLRISHGSGPMIVNQNAYTAKATLGENKVTVSTDNVELMRVYFNDQMIDFKRSVAVIVNGKTRFEGFLKPDIGEMLKDQVFLGRGWRYFSALADVDLGAPTATRPTRRAN